MEFLTLLSASTPRCCGAGVKGDRRLGDSRLLGRGWAHRRLGRMAALGDEADGVSCTESGTLRGA